jgi:hypothetical protein
LTANNNGIPEPDNLGQALHLASLFVDASHPLVSKVLAAVREFQQQTATPVLGTPPRCFFTCWSGQREATQRDICLG